MEQPWSGWTCSADWAAGSNRPPSGPSGPPGVVLAHTLFVPAGGTPEANGQALAAALASVTNASAANPYLVQLDAGTYTPPVASGTAVTSLQIPEYVSISGAGMSATLIVSKSTAFAYQSSANTGTVANLSDFTVTSSGGYAISIENVSTLLVDHVQTNGYADFTSSLTGGPHPDHELYFQWSDFSTSQPGSCDGNWDAST